MVNIETLNGKGQVWWVWIENVSVDENGECAENLLSVLCVSVSVFKLSVQCWVWQCRIWGMPHVYPALHFAWRALDVSQVDLSWSSYLG